MTNFSLTPEAQSDLDIIWEYIARDNVKYADNTEDKIIEAFNHLSQHPFSGHMREDLTDQKLRFWNVYSYLVIYDAETDPINIIRVLSGYRDVGDILS